MHAAAGRPARRAPAVAAAATSRSPRRPFPTNSATCWSPTRCCIFAWRIRRIRCIQFFETYFVLQEPTYSSIYPDRPRHCAGGRADSLRPSLGRRASVGGRVLRALLLDAAGVDHAGLGASRADCWPRCEFGPLNQWMNGYWGGAVSAIAGCLVFGALPRLRDSLADSRRRLTGSGARHAVAHAPLRVLFTARECAAVLSAVGAPTGRLAGARASRSGGGAGRAACHPLNARPEQTGHRQLDHPALCS